MNNASHRPITRQGKSSSTPAKSEPEVRGFHDEKKVRGRGMPESRRSRKPGRRLSAPEKVKRDGLVVADRFRGFTWEAVARRHGLTTRQCQKIVKAAQLHPEPLTVWESGIDVINEHCAFLEQAIGELAELAETATNEAVRLGAIKARIDAVSRRTKLLMDAGVLPPHLALTDMKREVVDLYDSLEVLGADLAATREERAKFQVELAGLLNDFANEHPKTWAGWMLREVVERRRELGLLPKPPAD